MKLWPVAEQKANLNAPVDAPVSSLPPAWPETRTKASQGTELPNPVCKPSHQGKHSGNISKKRLKVEPPDRAPELKSQAEPPKQESKPSPQGEPPSQVTMPSTKAKPPDQPSEQSLKDDPQWPEPRAQAKASTGTRTPRRAKKRGIQVCKSHKRLK